MVIEEHDGERRKAGVFVSLLKVIQCGWEAIQMRSGIAGF